MRPKSGFLIAPNWPYSGKITMTSQYAEMASLSKFFDVVLFLLSSSVTGQSFMSISFALEIRPSEFCLISGDWGELAI